MASSSAATQTALLRGALGYELPATRAGAAAASRLLLPAARFWPLPGWVIGYWTGRPDTGPGRAQTRTPSRSGQRRHRSRQDVPIYLTGLGTVQALYTVAIHAQVDGKLQDVFFKEGQRVKKGDVLAKIDPRLYQAALDQAKARKAMDEAALDRRAKGSGAVPDAGPAKTPKPSRTSTCNSPRSIRPRLRSMPTKRRSRPRRPISITPISSRRPTAAWACAWSIRATSCMPAIPGRDRNPDADTAHGRTLHAAGADARRRARRDGARRGRGRRLSIATMFAC